MPRRPAVVILLPVWGDRYISQFLDLGLRTLLAPGNIPAIAAECDCTFKFLTTSGQEQQFQGHPMFELLSRTCAVEFTLIDDLADSGVSSMAITLAFIRAMRERGAAMTQTYFVFLVADYIMADGSIGNLLRYIRAGVSGVTAGNFQIVKETAEPIIRGLVRDPSAPLAISPRALLTISFDHLHPVVHAAMPVAHQHTILCNRVFWQAGAGTLVGRFYLRHMLCIRPETDEFEVGSSSDYSFIPEMCPSGNVVAIADSDDYCVIEMQPQWHEEHCIVPGRLTPRRLAGYLSDWTTADHRRNANTPVLFHTGDVSSDVAGIVAETEEYVRRVAARLPAATKPVRGHHYWHAAQRAAAETIERQRRFGARAFFTRNRPEDLPPSAEKPVARMAFARQVYERLARQGLFQFPWHPGWLDSRREAQVVLEAMQEPAGLVVTDRPTPGSDWAARRTGERWRFARPTMLDKAAVNGGPFTVCLLYLTPPELSSMPDVLRRIRPHLSAGARTVVIFGAGWTGDPTAAIAALADGDHIERIDVVRSLARSSIGVKWSRILMRAYFTVSSVRWARAGAGLSVLAAVTLVSNIARVIVPGWPGSPTSVFVTLRNGDKEGARA